MRNPEIRFRVPKHVHELAQQKAEDLGLKSRRGLTGGASELARGALYTYLGLGLPGDLNQLGQQGFEKVRATRRAQEPGDRDLVVTVHHRVNSDYRKRKALEQGQAVASRSTTEFRFPQGQLPDFLVPYMTLTDDGWPFATLNLEGALSPRRQSLGELVAATDSATLDELKACLNHLRQKRTEREREKAERAERLERGSKILKDWASRSGSELLQARLDGDFDWLDLASREYARSQLAKLGLKNLEPLELTESLESADNPYRNVRLQNRPQLASMTRLKELRELADSGLDFHIVCVDGPSGSLEGIHVSLELPIPGRLHFLKVIP